MLGSVDANCARGGQPMRRPGGPAATAYAGGGIHPEAWLREVDGRVPIGAPSAHDVSARGNNG